MSFIVFFANAIASDSVENLDEWSQWFDANKETIEGEMLCKITDQIIVEVEEGKPKRFSGYHNQPKVGDKLSLIYRTFGEQLKFQLKHPSNVYFDTNINAEKGEARFQVASFYDGSELLKYFFARLTIRKDSLSFQKYNIAGGYSLELERYYKSDWGGIFTAIYMGEPQVITLDCRHRTDKIDEIIERYETYPGKLVIKNKSNN